MLVAAVGCGKAEGTSEAPLGQARQAAVSGPDFVVTAVSGPASTPYDRSNTVSVTVCNQGTVSDSTQVELLLSTDAIIEMPESYGPGEDLRISGSSPQYLDPGECRTLPMHAHFSSSIAEGAYYLGAIVDPDNTRPELIEDNNTKTGNRMGVGSKGDFFIKSVAGPASAQMGQSITVTVTVCNQGTFRDSTRVDLMLSSDATIEVPEVYGPYEDVRLAASDILYLEPGQCQTVDLQSTVSAYRAEAYYLGAVADYDNARPELIEDNNTKAGNVINVTP